MAKPPIDLQQQVTWKYPDRPVLLGWDIKARNYNTFIMGCFFTFTIFITIVSSLFMYWIGLDKKTGEWFNWMSATGAFLIFVILFPLFYAWTHPRKTLVYRCTAQGFETQSWNDIEIWKKVVLIMGIIIVLVVLGVAMIFPPAILALFIGPPLMAFFYFRMMSSEAYWQIQRDFSKTDFDWHDPEIVGLSIDKKRFIITLFVQKKGRLFYKILSYKFHIFCPKERFAELTQFFKEQLPQVEYKEGRADVYSHEC